MKSKIGTKIKKNLSAIFMVAVVGGMAGTGAYGLATFPSAEDGATYLKDQGYSHIESFNEASNTSGTNSSGCGRYSFSRTYQATDEDGNDVKKVLCFSGFHRITDPGLYRK